jgi:hypothetical protein
MLSFGRGDTFEAWRGVVEEFIGTAFFDLNLR